MRTLKKIWVVFNLLLLTVQIIFAQSPPAISYPTPNIYTINLPIVPLQPVNTGGAVPPNAYGGVSTLAGKGVPGNSNGKGNIASFNAPIGAVADAAGNIYIADSKNYQVRKIKPDGNVSVFAGSGVQGNADGNGLAASFAILTDITIDKNGNLYVVDGLNLSIRKITPSGDVTTPVTGLNQPYGIALDAAGNMFVSQPFSYVILKITPGGVKTVFAGSGNRGWLDGKGIAASFNQPTFMVIDASGNLIVADGGNSILRKIAPDGTVGTFAGNRLSTGASDGTGTYASFNNPNALSMDALGNIYIVDTGNNLIRRSTSAGDVITIAGSLAGNIDDVHKKAKFFYPLGVAVDATGNLFIADYGNNNIRKVQITGYAIDKDLPAGLVFNPKTGIISGTPSQVWPRTRYKVTAYNLKGESTAVVNIEVKPVPLPVVLAPVITYTTPNVYAINKVIPALKPKNTGGDVPATVYGTTTIFAGTGQIGAADGSGNTAQFTIPYGITTDADNNIYITEGVSRLRQIQPDGFVTTIGTDGNPGAPFNVPKFNTPKGVVRDKAGNLFIANYGNHNILKVTPDGIVSVFAGGSPGGGFKDGQGTAATITWPNAIAIDANDNLYVTDYTNRIRKISPSGYVYTIAGDGQEATIDGKYTASSFKKPFGIAVDAAGNIFVTELAGNVIRKITPGGDVTTFAGNGQFAVADGTGTAASFAGPSGITIDKSGNLYITQLQPGLIRRITPDQVVTIIAGGGSVGVNEGVGTKAYFNSPPGIVTGADGNLYIADATNYLKKVIATGYTIDKQLPAGLTFDVKTGIITGTPTETWPATDYTVTAYNGGGSSRFIVNIKVVDEVTPLITASAVTSNIIECEGKPFTGYQHFFMSASGLSGGNINVYAPPGFLVGGAPTGYGPSLSYGVFNGGVTNVDIYIKLDDNAITTAGSYSGNVILSYPGVADVTVPVSGEVRKLPTVDPVSDQPGICSGATLNLNFAGTADVYSWANSNPAIGLPASGTGNLSFIAQNNTSAPIAATITVTPNSTLGICPGTPVVFKITVSPSFTPVINIKQTNVTCPGQLVIFNAIASNGGAIPTYQWQVNGSNAGTNSAVFSSSTLQVNDVITCAVTNTDNFCGAPMISNTLKVFFKPDDPRPTIYMDKRGTVPVCTGAPVTFTAFVTGEGANPTYQWFLNGLPVIPANPSKIYTTDKLVNGDFLTCTVINNDGCTPIVSNIAEYANIVSGTLQVSTVTVNSSVPMPVCTGTEVTFTPIPANFPNSAGLPTYVWYLNGTMVGSNNTYVTSTLASGDQVYCLMTTYGNCAVTQPVQSNTIKVTLIIPASPAVSIVSNSNGCQGEEIAFNAIAVNGGINPTYKWMVNGIQVNNADDIFKASTLVTGDKVTCTVVNNDGCLPVSSPVSAAVTIIANPKQVSSVTISTGAIMPACVGQVIEFVPVPANYQTSAGLPTYVWYLNGIMVTNNSTYSSGTLADGDQVYCLMTTYGNCVVTQPVKSNIFTVIIKKQASPTVSIGDRGTISGCAGLELSFTATVTDAGINPTYKWMVNGVQVNNAGSTFNTSTLATGDKVNCVVVNNDGCLPVSSPVSATIDIIADPVQVSTVTINISTTMPVCAGKAIEFVPIPANYQTAGGPPAYMWYVNGSPVSNKEIFSSTELANGDQVYCLMVTYGKCVAPTPAQSNTITVSLSPESGCLIPPIVIPNAFTPNGDGRNDTWSIPALANYPACMVNVFNRYGASVFQSVGYTKEWAGVYNKGALPPGTYYYIIDPKSGQDKLSGYVIIMR